MSDPARSPGRPWWRGAVIYEIYPRSFQDTNGDGVGDLPGITRRLAHVAALGADAIWICPFFPSPMKDFGYDVSDYRDVDRRFGTLADFDRLVAAAHGHGLKVMIDLVLSHTSQWHPWFQESRASRDNAKADWYVWADAKPDGTPPNNWLSVFGGPAWQWEPRRRQYYLHNFLAAQPDLNFHTPAVQEAVLDVARFWLDRGVDGFRLDTINFYFHDKELRDNPALAPEARRELIAPAVNPYNHQLHLYDKNRPENLDFLRRLRRLLDRYGAVALGEVGDNERGLEIVGEYTSGGDKVQMCYGFDFLARAPASAARVVEVLGAFAAAAPDGWPCWAFSNHDVVRHVSRWELSDAAARAHATLLATLRGSICLYQGEELGLPEVTLQFDDLQDPYGIEFWPEYRGRDGCRTPMPWERGAPHGGFTTGRPWLPVTEDHLARAVDVQERDPGSLLHHYRRVLAFRRAHPALVAGDLAALAAAGDVLSFERRAEGERLFCALNLGPAPAELTVPAGRWTPVGAEIGAAAPEQDGRVRLAPWQPCFLVSG